MAAENGDAAEIRVNMGAENAGTGTGDASASATGDGSSSTSPKIGAPWTSSTDHWIELWEDLTENAPIQNVVSSEVDISPGNAKYPELDNLFKLHETIGHGGFSKVKVATDLFTGGKVAIKIVNKEKVGSELHRIDLEMETHQPLRHPHICKLYSVFVSKINIFMIMEYCPTDLYEHIVKQDDILPLDESRRIFIQLIAAVAYLHSNGIVHRDLKPENVLLDGKMDVKLADFGLCAVPGSPAYCAPELLREPPYIGSKVDVWSLGIMLFVLVAKELPFYSKNPNVSLRPSLHALWSHPWVQEGHLDPFSEQIRQSEMEEEESKPLLFSKEKSMDDDDEGDVMRTPSPQNGEEQENVVAYVETYPPGDDGDKMKFGDNAGKETTDTVRKCMPSLRCGNRTDVGTMDKPKFDGSSTEKRNNGLEETSVENWDDGAGEKVQPGGGESK
ncbi:Maternal embryonic leucine zipper kinase [Folsomia candida]|uniref:Maternal embryonic leucine zipper kinase n=1 Tax=Folsomia candida TaxID=158441 RepID=A0A226DDX7_FOLCA|nr:Maternal embryonic leucine zipper kinase [Folsomia candida]